MSLAFTSWFEETGSNLLFRLDWDENDGLDFVLLSNDCPKIVYPFLL
jgi:hypothetical protein